MTNVNAPAPGNYGDFRAMWRFNGQPGLGEDVSFQAPNGSSYTGDFLDLNPDTCYDFWMVINNASDQITVYMQPSSVTGTPTSLGTYTFRTPTTEAIDTLRFPETTVSYRTADNLIDDIYMDTGSANLCNPIPEPASLGLFTLAALTIGRR